MMAGTRAAGRVNSTPPLAWACSRPCHDRRTIRSTSRGAVKSAVVIGGVGPGLGSRHDVVALDDVVQRDRRVLQPDSGPGGVHFQPVVGERIVLAPTSNGHMHLKTVAERVLGGIRLSLGIAAFGGIRARRGDAVIRVDEVTVALDIYPGVRRVLR